MEGGDLIWQTDGHTRTRYQVGRQMMELAVWHRSARRPLVKSWVRPGLLSGPQIHRSCQVRAHGHALLSLPTFYGSMELEPDDGPRPPLLGARTQEFVATPERAAAALSAGSNARSASLSGFWTGCCRFGIKYELATFDMRSSWVQLFRLLLWPNFLFSLPWFWFLSLVFF